MQLEPQLRRKYLVNLPEVNHMINMLIIITMANISTGVNIMTCLGETMEVGKRPQKEIEMAMNGFFASWSRISRKLVVLTRRDESRSGPEKNMRP